MRTPLTSITATPPSSRGRRRPRPRRPPDGPDHRPQRGRAATHRRGAARPGRPGQRPPRPGETPRRPGRPGHRRDLGGPLGDHHRPAGHAAAPRRPGPAPPGPRRPAGQRGQIQPPGAPIRVTLHSTDGWAELRIADTGIGTPESERDRVFDRFFRGSNGRHQGTHGSGLGLSLAGPSSLARGTIRLAANEPTGTVVCVRLPLHT
ncbi:ATP-binding protein [Actinoplanes octamycinicus]|uniref:sensor histidine kinase n=1 Tax=Actinoplanes octamycinicus TaxID=135948 RepID=UPI0031EC89D1